MILKCDIDRNEVITKRRKKGFPEKYYSGDLTQMRGEGPSTMWLTNLDSGLCYSICHPNILLVSWNLIFWISHDSRCKKRKFNIFLILKKVPDTFDECRLLNDIPLGQLFEFRSYQWRPAQVSNKQLKHLQLCNWIFTPRVKQTFLVVYSLILVLEQFFQAQQICTWWSFLKQGSQINNV